MIHILDLNYGRPQTIAAFLLETSAGPVLIETGPDSCFDHLSAGLAQHGYRPQDIAQVFLTHVHLDHSGAAWRFAQMGSTLYAHPKALPHLTDPSKLWASATRIYGDQMQALWGQIAPISPERIKVLGDGEEVWIGQHAVVAYDTPGHAPHHLAFRVGANLFTGDVGGVKIGRGPVIPPCPPPDIIVEVWQQSMHRLAALPINTLFLTHFGAYAAQGHFAALEQRLLAWAEWMKQGLRQHSQEGLVQAFEHQVAQELTQAGLSAHEVADYEKADPSWMSVAGLSRYWQKHHPEALV